MGLCSVLTVAVAIQKCFFYERNKRDIKEFIPRLQKELAHGNLDGAQSLAVQLGGIIGEVTEEAIRIWREYKVENNMGTLFEIWGSKELFGFGFP